MGRVAVEPVGIRGQRGKANRINARYDVHTHYAWFLLLPGGGGGQFYFLEDILLRIVAAPLGGVLGRRGLWP